MVPNRMRKFMIHTCICVYHKYSIYRIKLSIVTVFPKPNT